MSFENSPYATFYRKKSTSSLYLLEASHTVYNQDDDVYVSYIHSKTTVGEFISLFGEDQQSRINVFDTSGIYVSKDKYDTKVVGTGFTVELLDTNRITIDKVTIIIYGDINGDGYVNISDKILLNRYLSGKEYFTTYKLAAADVNHDGKANSLDMTIINYQLSGSADFEENYYIKFD